MSRPAAPKAHGTEAGGGGFPRITAPDGLVVLAAGTLCAEIAPAAGGSVASLFTPPRTAGATRRVDWLRPASVTGLKRRDPLAMGSFPLLPFCNCIRAGKAQFEGREILFLPNHPTVTSPHPLHGIGWQRIWSVTRAEATEADLALRVLASPAWPWRFSATQRFTLTERGLAVAMTLTNEDTAAMPAGIGHHPYFPHLPGTRLTAATQALWRADAEVMPIALEAGDEVKRLREGVVLDQLDLDNNFTGWERVARIDWPADGIGAARRLELHAEAPLDYFVLYCPRGADHFCAEPVSQCTDWLNLMPLHGPAPLGGTRLEPGQSLTTRFTLEPGWA